MVNERLQIDLFFLDDIIALRRMDVFSKNSLLSPVRCENTQEAWGAFSNLRFEIFRPPKSIQVDEGGEWMHEVQAEFCPERRTQLLFQRMDAGPCILERGNGVARLIYNRLCRRDRKSWRREFPWWLDGALTP